MTEDCRNASPAVEAALLMKTLSLDWPRTYKQMMPFLLDNLTQYNEGDKEPSDLDFFTSDEL